MKPHNEEGQASPAADPLALIAQRIDGLTEWLAENAPYGAGDQKHLDEHSVERAYWHYGYLMALKDMKRLLERPEA